MKVNNIHSHKITSVQRGVVRTLCHLCVPPTVLCIFPSLIMSLDREASEHGEPTAAGLLKFVKTPFFHCYSLSCTQNSASCESCQSVVPSVSKRCWLDHVMMLQLLPYTLQAGWSSCYDFFGAEDFEINNE